MRFPDGHAENVRLLGVDTPEVHTTNDPLEFEGIPDSAAGRDWLRDWGHKASEFARTRLLGEQVTVAVDDRADRRGSFGRLLVYVYAGGETTFNRELIEQGYARLYESTFAKYTAFGSAEATAQSTSVGLWDFEATTTSTPTPTTTATPTTTTTAAGEGDLAVARIHADAPGNDHENLNEEYIVFENVGDAPLDLSGWTVADDAGHTYVFPSGFTLEPGAQVTLYTGSGTDSDSALYWGSGSAIWNNGGDTIIVRDDGTVVLRRSYS